MYETYISLAEKFIHVDSNCDTNYCSLEYVCLIYIHLLRAFQHVLSSNFVAAVQDLTYLVPESLIALLNFDVIVNSNFKPAFAVSVFCNQNEKFVFESGGGIEVLCVFFAAAIAFYTHNPVLEKIVNLALFPLARQSKKVKIDCIFPNMLGINEELLFQLGNMNFWVHSLVSSFLFLQDNYNLITNSQNISSEKIGIESLKLNCNLIYSYRQFVIRNVLTSENTSENALLDSVLRPDATDRNYTYGFSSLCKKRKSLDLSLRAVTTKLTAMKGEIDDQNYLFSLLSNYQNLLSNNCSSFLLKLIKIVLEFVIEIDKTVPFTFTSISFDVIQKSAPNTVLSDINSCLLSIDLLFEEYSRIQVSMSSRPLQQEAVSDQRDIRTNQFNDFSFESLYYLVKGYLLILAGNLVDGVISLSSARTIAEKITKNVSVSSYCIHLMEFVSLVRNFGSNSDSTIMTIIDSMKYVVKYYFDFYTTVQLLTHCMFLLSCISSGDILPLIPLLAQIWLLEKLNITFANVSSLYCFRFSI